ncbi:hypothetical protein EDD18DRAFT_1201728 [Armillaria luteobubalina]|uniref:F-box domain-containing protein n=1 Tax=Armillaria luteobubalina TaxID=153913 RepID=A0AA39UGW8_9AGAR|nr:hypothetical protein EDD18DRAFT_1201728 [Armillaria luteobubalina]
MFWTPCPGCACPNHSVAVFAHEPLPSPTFTRIANSNDPPLPAESAAIRGLITEQTNRVSALETQRTHLEAYRQALLAQASTVADKIAALERERERVTQDIQEHKRLLSPVRRLPPEVLALIFLESIVFPIKRTPSASESEWWDIELAESPMWVIEQVCRQWRRVSVSCPELWSYINITITDDNFKEDGYAYVRCLTHQFSRSRLCPLSLSITDISNQSSFDKLPPPLVTLLLSVASRIRELHLLLSAAIFSTVPAVRLALPSLTKLCLLSTDAEEISRYNNLNLFDAAPNLHVVEAMNIRDPVTYFALPWHQITRYKSDHLLDDWADPGPDTGIHLQSIKSQPQLVECDLRCEVNCADGVFSSKLYPVVCTRLRMLSLSSWAYSSTGVRALHQILDRLMLPVLESLRVVCQEGHPELEGEQTFSALRRLVERSHAPLEVLYFEHGEVREEDMGAVLRAAPALRDLRLVDVNLGVLPLGEDVVPDLRVLRLSAAAGLDRQMWVDVVSARAGRLEEVRIEKTGGEEVVLDASQGKDGRGLIIH